MAFAASGDECEAAMVATGSLLAKSEKISYTTGNAVRPPSGATSFATDWPSFAWLVLQGDEGSVGKHHERGNQAYCPAPRCVHRIPPTLSGTGFVCCF